MDTILMVVVFAFLIETVVEILKPLLHKLDGMSAIIGVEMAYVASLG